MRSTNISPLPSELIDRLRCARQVVAFCGAGLSAASGLPTFREAQTGLWARYRPEDLATPEAFRRDPTTVWRWYAERRRKAAAAAPNPGHYALVALADRLAELTIVTQNVDGLQQRAGSIYVVEFHGNLFEDRCFAEDRRLDVDEMDTTTEPPQCRYCGGPVRPGVVWFGEMIPTAALDRASAAVNTADVFMSIGTSSQVYPAAGLAGAARQAGATLVEINPQQTPHSNIADFLIVESAATALPRLVAALTA